MNIHAFVGIRTPNPSKRSDAGQRRRQCGNRHQASIFLTHYNTAPSDMGSFVGYRLSLILPLLSTEGHSLNTYIFKTHRSY